MNKAKLPNSYFSSLLPELVTRAARATVSRLGFSNAALRKHLNEIFSANLGEPGCFVGEPVFEATFGWQSADRTLSSLSPELLNPLLLDALDKPSGVNAENYRFAKDILPYKHQLEAWRILANPAPQSVIVTSGTGSGKTECFMVPILNQLANEVELHAGTLQGVRALFLYPLNALIQSQQERLSAWTGPFKGNIRFCLYNGQTQDKQPQHLRDATPNQVIDRETLRASPPPILVTNATMLEYMLVRAQDAPILQKSEGQLRWIVLDEAHSYIGSQAAELALLLRRVLHGFGVNSSEVRFVATSATIGDPKGEAGQKLRDFLAGLAGVSNERVHVVSGQRAVPQVSAGNPTYAEASLEALEHLRDEPGMDLFEAVSGNNSARRIRQLFVPDKGGKAANPLSSICEVVAVTGANHGAELKSEALRWLDLLTLSTSVQGKEATPFLPLRLHAFHNVLAGLWACCNPHCTCRHGSHLDSQDWPFGAVYTESREMCDCGSPVFELRTCNDCNEAFLWAVRSRVDKDGFYRLTQEADQLADDFQLEEESLGDPDKLIEDDAFEVSGGGSNFVLIANQFIEGTGEICLEVKSQIIDKPDSVTSINLRVRDEDEGLMKCPGCGGHHGNGKMMFRSSRLGAPFLLMQAIPTLMEFCPDGDFPNTKPMRGRRLITFTDSRQGTARIAATLQRDAERNSLRSLVYQYVTTGADAENADECNKLLDQITQLKALKLAAVAPAIATLEAEMAKKSAPKLMSFDATANHLAQHESDINKWALTYYRDVNPDLFEGDWGSLELARLYLVREFSNRPKRANSLETMGMVSVQYPKLQKVIVVPTQVLMVAKLTVEEWQQLLKTAVDFVVRDFTAIELNESWRKWIGKKARTSHLLPPLTPKEEKTSFLKIWPQSNKVGVQNRMVRLIAVLLNKDPTNESGRDSIDFVLRVIWEELVRIDL
jgi:DEAD/DEAH box helicase domain-containing protein